MTWYAKPSGEYAIDSEEAISNVGEINTYLNGIGYTLEAQAGLLGNVYEESKLNPWRYQNDSLSGAGYGLFQYTPKSDYLSPTTVISSLPNYSPNRSVTSVTSGATAADGYAQLIVFNDDMLGKWTTTCWRPYWSTSTYAALYAFRQTILDTWGNGSSLTLTQFATINNIEAATFAFLACFEGPSVPDYADRLDNANIIYTYLGGSTLNLKWLPGAINNLKRRKILT